MAGNSKAAPRDVRIALRADGLAERRSGHRIHTVCRFARVESRTGHGLWRVCNISDLGMMFKCHRRPVPGERLSIALADDIRMEAAVVWSDAEHCGVRFDAPIDSGAVLGALARSQRSPDYRPLRLDVEGWALAFDDSGVHSVRIRNLSRCGVGLSHLGQLQRGSSVKLVLETGAEHRGIVRWASSDRAGLSLLEPFSPEELETASLI